MLNLLLTISKGIKLKLSKIHINQNGMKNLLCMLINIIQTLNPIIIGNEIYFFLDLLLHTQYYTIVY
jgi:hypothetical protein